MTRQFTPGPWSVDGIHRPFICHVGNNSGDPAVFGAPSPVGEPYVFGDKLADAQLIAEAPTMFDLLACALDEYERMGGKVEGRHWSVEARACLDRAEGLA